MTDSSEFGAVSLSDVTDRLTGPTLFDVVACKSMSFTSTANRLGSVLAVAFCYSLSHSQIAACSPPTRQSLCNGRFLDIHAHASPRGSMPPAPHAPEYICYGLPQEGLCAVEVGRQDPRRPLPQPYSTCCFRVRPTRSVRTFGTFRSRLVSEANRILSTRGCFEVGQDALSSMRLI